MLVSRQMVKVVPYILVLGGVPVRDDTCSKPLVCTVG